MKKSNCILFSLLIVIIVIGCSGCGSTQGYEKITNLNGEVEEYQVGGFEKAIKEKDNDLYFEDNYSGAKVEIVAPLESVNGKGTRNGHYMQSYISLKGGWIVDTSDQGWAISDLSKGDMVKVTGQVIDFTGLFIGRDGWVDIDENPVVEPYEE